MKIVKNYIISLILLISILCSCSLCFGKEVIADGIAVIGDGITMDEAKIIAFNDARKNALNSVGAFVESETKVSDYKITSDEIRIITGAIMKGEIIDVKKEVENNVFILKVNAKFIISEESLNKAFNVYSERNEDRKIILSLIRNISKLQEDIGKVKKGDDKLVSLVKEVKQSYDTLDNMLTTSQKINYERQMQGVFKEKLNNVLNEFSSYSTSILQWEDVPHVENNILTLKYKGILKNK